MSTLRDKTIKTLKIGETESLYYSLESLEALGFPTVSAMPVSAKILLESVLRQIDGRDVTEDHLSNIASWKSNPGGELPFKPARVIMQDFTGVPGIVDLAAMRDALAGLGGDPNRINPLIPVDLVVDHSVQVDKFGSSDALTYNSKMEFQRNRERYGFLRWASDSFKNFTVVPPATGIVHQVNLEYLAKVVRTSEQNGKSVVFPDTLVGTDSHTTMINGLGVLGWGVGGIEAEAALLGQPLYIRMPEIIGVRFSGSLKEGVTATDLVLLVTETLRNLGVVGKLIEFFGPGVGQLTLPDRATISNMCPEYGATAAIFPVDGRTIEFLRTTGRPAEQVELVETYTKAQGMFRPADASDLEYTRVVEIDISSVEPSVAGPRRPQDRNTLSTAGSTFASFAKELTGHELGSGKKVEVTLDGKTSTISDGSIVVAAITSCTNTSNPSVMMAAGLVAKRAAELGMKIPAHVKTSLAPGSTVVTRYLDLAGLSPYLDKLGFNVVGYGCTTCIGNSGPLPEVIDRAVSENDILAVSVLSGNRNFEGRIHARVRANYLASPPLVVAYALAGRIDIDLSTQPIGTDSSGNDVYLKDLWPGNEEIADLVAEKVAPELYRSEYANVSTGNEEWNKVKSTAGERYEWDPESTYIKLPPFFDGLTLELPELKPINNARVLAMLGDSVTTDHISPAGMIADDSPAARWLNEREVTKVDFNSYGSRRGNHEVMMRGTLANIRIRNKLIPEVEGGYTAHLPDGEQMSMYDAAMRYAGEGIPLIIIAGKDYGMGSSRDWAAKGVGLLGVKAAIAESYERIHRSNLIGMGVLPLQFIDGETPDTLGLSGKETFDIGEVSGIGAEVTVTARGSGPGAEELVFKAIARIDTEVEMDYFKNGGILHTVLRQMAD
jgi:aconitate hydratase